MSARDSNLSDEIYLGTTVDLVLFCGPLVVIRIHVVKDQVIVTQPHHLSVHHYGSSVVSAHSACGR